MGLWSFNFFDENYNLTPFKAKLGSIIYEQNKFFQVTFKTKRTNGLFYYMMNNPNIVIFYNDDYVCDAQIGPVKVKATVIECTAYNATYKRMEKFRITGSYVNTAANVVMTAICDAAGVNFDYCPETAVSVRFEDADCFTAAKFVAESLNTGFYGYYNAGAETYFFGVGDDSSSRYPSRLRIKEINIDQSQRRDRVRIRGVDESGIQIIGEYGEEGSGGTAVFIEKKASTKEQLDILAQKKYEEMHYETDGIPAVIPIDEGYQIRAGDNVYVNSSVFDYGGWGKVKKATVTATKVDVELDRAKPTLEQIILDLQKYGELGVYRIEPDQLTPWSLVTQGLFGLYHLNEGDGTVAKDSGPNNETPNDGEITEMNVGSFWTDGVIPGTQSSQFHCEWWTR